MDCGLKTIQAIEFLSGIVQYLFNCGLNPDVTLLQEMYTYCDNFYRSIQLHTTQTRSGSDESWAINLHILKRNTMPNSIKFSNWMRNMASTLNKSTYSYGFTLLRFVIREINDHVNHVDFSQDTTFLDRWKSGARKKENTPMKTTKYSILRFALLS